MWPTNLKHLPFFSLTDDVGSLSTVAVVGITATVTGIVALIVGFLAGVLVYHCIHNHQLKSSKPKSSSNQHQDAVSASNPQQLTGPEYEEVVEMRRNKSYEFRPNIEMRANISKRQPQSSEPESSSQQQQQTSTEYEKPVPDPSNDGKIDLRENAACGPSNVDFVL